MPATAATLLLPGMTLNGTIFSTLPGPTKSIDFATLALSGDGRIPDHRAGPMGPYLDILEAELATWDAWATTRTRIVIGHSFGGMLLLKWLIERRPAAPIHGAVLIATTAGPMFDAVRMRLPGGVRVPVKPLMGMWNHAMMTRLLKRTWTGGTLAVRPVDFQTLRNRSDAAVERAGWRNTGWRSMRSFRFALEGFDVRERLPEIDIPVSVLHGTRDSLFPPSAAETLAMRMTDCRLNVIPGAGHALPLTHPDEVAVARHELLARITHGRGRVD